ncbi:hypothetical protein AB0H49_24325 [Nocardia sp. NPDC050713]
MPSPPSVPTVPSVPTAPVDPYPGGGGVCVGIPVCPAALPAVPAIR